MLLTVTPQLWDSQQLNLRAAVLNDHDIQALETLSLTDRQEALRQALDGVEANMVMAKIDHDASGLLTALLSVGGCYIGAECLFVHVHAPVLAAHPGAEVRFVSQCDPQPFLELAEDIHHSRFAMDPHLNPQAVRRLWRSSITNHCEGLAQELAILYVDDTPAGLVVLGINTGGSSAQLKIVGLRRAYRGQGLGRVLLTPTILRHCLSRSLSVEAFSTNAAALRLYQGCGFRLTSIRHVVHWWTQVVPSNTTTSNSKERKPCKT